jgi:hypothetical protein
MDVGAIFAFPLWGWLSLGSPAPTIPVLVIIGLGGLLYISLVLWDLIPRRSPRRALLTVFAAVLYVEGIFANAYYWLSHRSPGAFNETLSRIDAAYFTVSTAMTTGLGDIHPLSGTARLVVIAQMIVSGFLLVFAAGIAINRRFSVASPTSAPRCKDCASAGKPDSAKSEGSTGSGRSARRPYWRAR